MMMNEVIGDIALYQLVPDISRRVALACRVLPSSDHASNLYCSHYHTKVSIDNFPIFIGEKSSN